MSEVVTSALIERVDGYDCKKDVMKAALWSINLSLRDLISCVRELPRRLHTHRTTALLVIYLFLYLIY